MQFNQETYIEEMAQELAEKVLFRFEEIQVEKATKKQLLKAKELIDAELIKRKGK